MSKIAPEKYNTINLCEVIFECRARYKSTSPMCIGYEPVYEGTKSGCRHMNYDDGACYNTSIWGQALAEALQELAEDSPVSEESNNANG